MRVDIDELRDRVTRAAIRARNLVRRVTISLTDNDGTWQARGYRGFEGAHGDLDGEKFDKTEVFPGIGIWARPKAGAVPEAIIVHVGGEPNHPVIIATRQKDLQVAIDEDETAIFNSQSVVLLKKDGMVEVRSRAGVAGALATKADIDALTSNVSVLRAAFLAHVHPGVTAGGVSTLVTTTPVASPPSAAGTQKLRAE